MDGVALFLIAMLYPPVVVLLSMLMTRPLGRL
jgi:hypothetical protein